MKLATSASEPQRSCLSERTAKDCPRARQRGQSAMEILIILPVLLVLVYGIIQFALIFQARAVLNHATMMAARAGALHNGDKAAMRTALASGLTPLFAHDASATGYASALAAAQLEVLPAANLANITVVNPTKAAMNDFGRPRLDGKSGNELPNDTLNYRDSSPGSNSKLSIQDANLIHVHVTYCYRLIVPLVNRVIWTVINSPLLSSNSMQNPFGIDGAITAIDPCLSYMPGLRMTITSEAVVRMQSSFYESNL
ncbi:MAG: pilus assembly protein [Burkholderiales bacterium]|nr:pilus assembly protein [Burkholderiales bacterium]